MKLMLFLDAICLERCIGRSVLLRVTLTPQGSGLTVWGQILHSVGTNTINRKWRRVPSLGVRTRSVWAVPATPENSEQKQHHYCFANFIWHQCSKVLRMLCLILPCCFWSWRVDSLEIRLLQTKPTATPSKCRSPPLFDCLFCELLDGHLRSFPFLK